MMVILGTVLCAVSRIFLEPMMVAFGATDKVLEYALTYTGITSLGFPFLIFTTGGEATWCGRMEALVFPWSVR